MSDPTMSAQPLIRNRYFFSSNSGVDGCANKREPGYEHMEWLRIQLQILRDRGMKAILMGHVPPARVDSKESWDETCWQKYTLWQRQFRDVIVGGLYGHMNIDHFMLQDFDEISKDADKGRMASGSSFGKLQKEGGVELYEDGEVTIASASDYLLDLREAWAQLPAPPAKSGKKSRSEELVSADEPSTWDWLMSLIYRPSRGRKADKSERKKYLEKIGGKFAERYSVTHVAPSVVPNYFPTLRIIEYNITGLENMELSSSFSNSRVLTAPFEQQSIIDTDDFEDDEAYLQDVEIQLKHKKKKKGARKYKFKVPEGPSKSSPPGPAYSPQVFTLTRFTQYFANLTRINNDFLETNGTTTTSNFESPSTIFGLNVTANGQIDTSHWKEGKHGKHQGKQPRPEPHPNKFVYEVEYDTKTDRGFKDLTVRRWVDYARKIGRGGHAAAAEKDAGDEYDEEVEDEDDDNLEEGNDHVQDLGKKHKHKGKKHKHRKATKEWYTFVRRAFVGTMNPHEIKQLFTGQSVDAADVVQENMEL
jgi:endopolyphosphatase